jgi:hypothetical protein
LGAFVFFVADLVMSFSETQMNRNIQTENRGG